MNKIKFRSGFKTVGYLKRYWS